MSVNHQVVYIPFDTDASGNELIYPTYVPIVVDEPEVLMATGTLSENDYNATREILHADEAGFPFAPLIAALAPLAIQFGTKLISNMVNKKKSQNASGTELAGYIPTNPNIRNLKDLQALYNSTKK